jgi:hypothetical protein
VLLALLVIGYTIIAIVYSTTWSAGWKGDFWWVLCLPALGVASWIVMFALILKGGDDEKTKKRGFLIS